MMKMAFGLGLTALLLQGCATFNDAAMSPTDRAKVDPSYLHTQHGNIVVSTGGDCVRTSKWDTSNNNLACGGTPPQMAAAVAPPPPPPPPVPRMAPKPAAPVYAQVRLDARALFEFDSASLTQQGQSELNKLVRQLRQNRGSSSLRVVGHTDSVGPAEYNQNLSQRRASAVRQYLRSALGRVSISADGYGESRPLADNKTPHGRRLNRRVEVEGTARIPVQQ